jgi:hypothetical protein
MFPKKNSSLIMTSLACTVLSVIGGGVYGQYQAQIIKDEEVAAKASQSWQVRIDNPKYDGSY